MNRREALKNFTLLLSAGFSVASLGIVNEGCQSGSDQKDDVLFTDEHENILAEIADTIIPDTDTPGAKKAGVGSFIVMMMNDCYPENTKQVVISGVNKIQKRSKSDYKKSFVSMSLEERENLLKKMEDESGNNNGISKSDFKSISSQFFKLTRELTLLGYFTSEIGATQVLTYVSVPGNYNPCTTLKEGQKAWAT